MSIARLLDTLQTRNAFVHFCTGSWMFDLGRTILIFYRFLHDHSIPQSHPEITNAIIGFGRIIDNIIELSDEVPSGMRFFLAEVYFNYYCPPPNLVLRELPNSVRLDRVDASATLTINPLPRTPNGPSRATIDSAYGIDMLALFIRNNLYDSTQSKARTNRDWCLFQF